MPHAGFRGSGILIKMWTIVDDCGPFCRPRGSEVQISHKTSKKGLKNIQKSIAALSHLANRTAHDLPNFGPFSVVTIQEGAMPPPDKNISALKVHQVLKA